MVDFLTRADHNVTKEINDAYKSHINELILFRFRLILAIGIVLHLAFWFIDRFAYPAHSFEFIQIRIIDSLLIIGLIFLSYWDKIKPHIVWLVDLAGTIVMVGMVCMVLLTNGSASRYYEGANLVFIGVCGIINPFYLGHTILMFIFWIGLFEVAMLSSLAPFDSLNFLFANYFMCSTALFVVLMAKFYKDQHYKAFARQEQLKINEETLAALYNQADRLAKTDALTDINNRRHFSDMLQKKMEVSEAANATFYLVIFDVDYFKQINDTYGHAFGDRVLVKVVEIVKNNIRTNDFIGRFGGDEFIICLDMPTRESIMARLSKISQDVRAVGLTHEGRNVPLTVSIGAARFKPGQNMNETKLMERADFELFHVKKTGRGQISIEE
jgi:diguanylate cyclase (GGDEF)-like protein